MSGGDSAPKGGEADDAFANRGDLLEETALRGGDIKGEVKVDPGKSVVCRVGAGVLCCDTTEAAGDVSRMILEGVDSSSWPLA